MAHRLPPAQRLARFATLVLSCAATLCVFSSASNVNATPTIKPLANEPIVRTLEPGEPPPAAAATAVVAEPAVAETPASAAPTETAPTEITNRQLALYALVVISLLGVMVIAILLIVRRADAKRTQTVHAPFGHPTLSSPPPRLPTQAPLHSEAAWTQQGNDSPRSTFLS